MTLSLWFGAKKPYTASQCKSDTSAAWQPFGAPRGNVCCYRTRDSLRSGKRGYVRSAQQRLCPRLCNPTTSIASAVELTGEEMFVVVLSEALSRQLPGWTEGRTNDVWGAGPGPRGHEAGLPPPSSSVFVTVSVT